MDDDERTRRRRRGLIGGLTALVVVLAGTLGFTTLRRNDASESLPTSIPTTVASTRPLVSPSSTTAPQPTTAPTSARPLDACPHLPAMSTIPATFTHSLTWSPSSVGALLPASSATGPARTAGAIGVCYAQSPGGALVAAIHTLSDVTTESWQRVLSSRIDTTSAGYPSLLTTIQTDPPNSSEKPTSRITGYRLVDYSPTDATFTVIYSQIAGPPVRACVVSMRWIDSDWKLRPSDSGSLAYGGCVDGTPTDYTALGI